VTEMLLFSFSLTQCLRNIAPILMIKGCILLALVFFLFHVFCSILGINGNHFASRHPPIARSDVLFSEVRFEA